MKELRTILVVIAVLLLANFVALLTRPGNSGGTLVSPAYANGVVVTKSGELVTTNQDGTKLYLWYNSRVNAPEENYKAVEFTK
jgi:hypothetical protein